MKKQFLAVAVLAALSGGACAEEFNYVGVSVGVNNRNIDGGSANVGGTAFNTNLFTSNPAGATREANVSVKLGHAWKLPAIQDKFEQATGVEVDLLMLNSKTIPMVSSTYIIGEPNGPHALPHVGYSAVTGATAGVDMLFQLPGSVSANGTSIRVGVTQFQKSVDGAKGLAQIGFVQKF